MFWIRLHMAKYQIKYLDSLLKISVFIDCFFITIRKSILKMSHSNEIYIFIVYSFDASFTARVNKPLWSSVILLLV